MRYEFRRSPVLMGGVEVGGGKPAASSRRVFFQTRHIPSGSGCHGHGLFEGATLGRKT
jgi:hypothetical protein